MAWTERQRDAIESRNESLLVSAAAGSGKTSVLVERVIQLVKEGTPLSRMLVVTFTNAAAAEMKERISKITGPAALRHAHISTFHKFAMDVIRKYYHVIGADPGFSICDEYKKSILSGEAMDEMFEDMFEKDDTRFIDFLNCYATAKSSKNARELILQFSAFLESLPNPEEFCQKAGDGSLYNVDTYLSFAAEECLFALERIITFSQSAFEILTNPKHPAKPMPKLAIKLATDIEGLKAIREHFNNPENRDTAFAELGAFKFTALRTTKAEEADYSLVRSSVELRRNAARDQLKEIASLAKNLSVVSLQAEKDLLQKPLSQLVYLAEEFGRRFSEKKKSEGLLDFSDIEHSALKILENPAVCEELRNSFDCIFVDEYQDSNLVQEELISRIAKPDNLFMVGDVKQSIYKFRLAEPEIFLSKYNAFRSGSVEKSRAIDLNSNFRSKAPVVEIVNKVFSAVMRKDSVGLDYDDDAALVEGAPYNGEYLYKPKMYLVSSEASGDGDEAIEELKDVELEALQAARIIKEWHGKTVYDSKAGKDRALEYKDMVILMRATKGRGEVFYKALEDAGIPVFLERGEGYFDTLEISLVLNLLRLLDNFSQDLPLISVLYFPVFGFTAEELAKIRIRSNKNNGHKDSYSKVFREYAQSGEDESLKKKASDFIATIDRWRKMEEAMPLADFLWQLLIDSGIGNFCRALPSGEQRFANLRALVDKVRNFEAQNASGLFGFINYIDAICKKGKVETGQVAMLGEGVDAVRIMTIHKSKGLEFPFVLLSGMTSSLGGKTASGSLNIHKDLGMSIKLVEPEKCLTYSPLAGTMIKIKKDREELAETIRVLYVAFTRAKDILVMSGVVKNAMQFVLSDKSLMQVNVAAAKNYLEMVAPSLEMSQFVCVPREDLSLSKTSYDASEQDVLKALCDGFEVDESKLPIPAEEIEERLNFDFSPDPESLLKSKYSVSEMAELLRPQRPGEDGSPKYYTRRKVPAFIKESKLDAAAVGTAYHSVMEHIPFNLEGKSPLEIEGFIAELKAKGILSEAEASVVEADKISAFFASELGKRACASSELHRESPFVMKTVFEGRRVFVQGTIDCWFREGDEFVLVDYKNSYIDPKTLETEKERLKESYIPQLALYKEALEKIKGIKVKEGILYLFGIDDFVRV